MNAHPMAINSVDKLDNNEIKFWIIGKKKMKYTLFDTGRCDDQLKYFLQLTMVTNLVRGADLPKICQIDLGH